MEKHSEVPSPQFLLVEVFVIYKKKKKKKKKKKEFLKHCRILIFLI